MKLCIPTLDARGLEAPLADHFGKAPHLTLLDSESGQARALEAEHSREHDCGRIGLLDGQDVDAVVVRAGIGRGAYAALTRRGIAVLLSGGDRVADVLDEARNGGLRQLDLGHTCAHHRDEHGRSCH